MSFSILFVLVLVLLLVKTSNNAPLHHSMQSLKRQLCSEIPTMELEKFLGGAFNPRYMSVDQPIHQEMPKMGSKRTVASYVDDFYVDPTFSEVLDDRPVWEVTNLVSIAKKNYGFHSTRRKRASKYLQEWNCKSKLVWLDLGPDYFPRYLRTVECLSDKCWFGLYKCKPRSFTVRLLRRRQGFCNDITDNSNPVGLVGLSHDLRQHWVWEERAVNFCCDCVR